MATTGQEISWFRGDSFPIQFTVLNKRTKAAIPLAGYTVTMTVDKEKDPPDDTTQLFSVEGVVSTDLDQVGVVTFTPLVAHTATAEIAKYYYDIQLVGADNTVRTVVKSTFSITQDITKVTP